MMLVGCPIYKRDYFLPAYYSHILIAARQAGIEDLAFVFVVDRTDEATITCIEQTIKLPTKIVKVDQSHAASGHQWNKDRFDEMVMLRNTLLNTVRGIDPDLFLSLDSDILIHPKAIKNMAESLDKFFAVGGKCYMTERGTAYPSYAMLGQSDNLIRPDTNGVIKVDCIMAMKLMTQQAYWIDYKYHDKGEDIGWSKSCKDAGFALAWDGRVTSKHVMSIELLNAVDERCGY